MPDNKLQHYVPRCYLRAFCADSAAAINLVVVQKGQSIRNAPTKGQCARNYLYGADGDLEKALQAPEGLYAATASKAIVNPETLDAADLTNMRTLMLLQTFRSFGYLQKQIDMANRHDADLLAAAGGDESKVELLKMDIAMAVEMSLGHFFEARKIITDLETVMVVNRSRVDFISSDDPAVHTNRFHVQRRLLGGFGLGSSGTVISMPVSPKLMLVAFDANVYTMPSRRGHLGFIDSDQDAHDLNELQQLHARHTLYFADWNTADDVLTRAADAKARRPDVWHVFRYFAEVKDGAAGTRYEPIEGMDMRDKRAVMQMWSQVHVQPANWTRLLRYRVKPRFVDTGTAVGYVRPDHPTLHAMRQRALLGLVRQGQS